MARCGRRKAESRTKTGVLRSGTIGPLRLNRRATRQRPRVRLPSADAAITIPDLDDRDPAASGCAGPFRRAAIDGVLLRRPVGSDGIPGWLEGVAGNPHAYDGPDGGRKGVCVRILPTTYAQLHRRGGAWTAHRCGCGSTSCGWASQRQSWSTSSIHPLVVGGEACQHRLTQRASGSI